jgi:hypothetical protein
MRKGSKVKAVCDITWAIVLGTAAPPTIIDSILVPAKTPGKVLGRDKDINAYLIEFENGHEWWLEKEYIEK